MDSNILQVISTKSRYLSTLPYKYGQLIFVENTRQLYFDHASGRTLYSQMIILETESQRMALTSPVPGLYFTKDSSIIYRYDTEWIQITTPPKEQMIFGTLNSFPKVGNETMLYIDSSTIYRWSNETQNYYDINSPKWGAF